MALVREVIPIVWATVKGAKMAWYTHARHFAGVPLELTTTTGADQPWP